MPDEVIAMYYCTKCGRTKQIVIRDNEPVERTPEKCSTCNSFMRKSE